MNEDQKKQLVRDRLLQDGHTQKQVANTTIRLGDERGSSIATFSVPIYPENFIRNVLIDELEKVVGVSPWLSFICISSGIEFLGKCIDAANPSDWNVGSRSPLDFKAAINMLNALTKYRLLLSRQDVNLYKALRCGLIHAYAPTGGISLSHGTKESPNIIGSTGPINLNADELYADFKAACEEVINMSFSDPNKMNVPKLYVNGTFSTNPEHQEGTHGTSEVNNSGSTLTNIIQPGQTI